MSLEIVTVPCLQDNYAYLLRDTASGKVGLIDAPEAGPIEAALDTRGWGLDMILITHHHPDHIDGVAPLRSRFGAQVVGAAADAARLPKLDMQVTEGDRVELGESVAEVIDVPGHTVGHIAYHFPEARALFSADSLMIMGCGRLFEGTAAQMWASLGKMMALPPETKVYSGHEYTEANLRFARSVTPDDPALKARAGEIEALRAQGAPTVPARLENELASNPFLRARDPAFKALVGMENAADVEVFAELRRRKDAF